METTESIKANLRVWKRTLSLKHRLEWMLRGTIKLPNGEYVFNCEYHGITSCYPQGYREILVCKACLKELDEDRRIKQILTEIEVKTNISNGELREPSDIRELRK